MKKNSLILAVLLSTVLSLSCSLDPQTDPAFAQGATSSYTINGFEANYPQVYLRGTFNSWNTTAMTLTSDHYWSADISFDQSASHSFKFDIHGDWSLNFGDNNQDHALEQNGANIPVESGKIYTITFNDASGYYFLYEKTWNSHIIIPVPSGLSISDFQGLKTFTYRDATKTGWNYIYTDSDPAAVISPVSGLDKGTYTVKFDDIVAGKRYTGAVSFSIDGSQDTVTNTLLLTEAPLTNFGSVKVTVLSDIYQNGNLSGQPVYGAGIFLGDWQAGYSLGTTGMDGSVTVSLEQGSHSLSMFKMTSSHSTMSSRGHEVTVSTDQTADLTIRTAPYVVSVSAFADAGFGNALYITGATDYLGGWSTAYKMHYDSSRGCWSFSKALPIGLPFKIVKAAWTDADQISTAAVVWEQGADRVVPQPGYYQVNITAYPQF